MRGRFDRAGRDGVDPGMGRRHDGLEAARGVAACAVLVFHVATRLGHTTIAGSRGPSAAAFGCLAASVQVFFGITGLVIGGRFIRAVVSDRAVAFRPYARKRLARIVPAYWLALTVLAIYPGLPGVFSSHWWRYYGFLQLYGFDLFHGLGPAWTLCVEMSFYFALPAIAFLGSAAMRSLDVYRRVSAVATFLLVTGALSFGFSRWRFAFPAGALNPWWTVFTLLGTWIYFVPGLLLALAFAAPRDHTVARLVALVLGRFGMLIGGLVMFGGFVLLAVQLDHPAAPELDIAARTAAGAGGLLLAMNFPRLDRRWGVAVVYLGTISYGIYLWHDPLALVARRLLGFSASAPATAVIPVTCLTAVITSAVAAASWHFIEQPILRRVASSRASSAPASEAASRSASPVSTGRPLTPASEQTDVPTA